MKPYGDGRTKKEQVEAMFDNIAPAYDRLNDIMSFGIARAWRRAAVRRVRRSGAGDILDLATGTGDLAVAMARKIPCANITGADLSEGMLVLAREKAMKVGLKVVPGRADSEMMPLDSDGITGEASSPDRVGGVAAGGLLSHEPGSIVFCRAEAERLPFADGSFDAVTVAFGVRNFADIPEGLRQIRRVLRPGGQVFIIEFSTPRGKIFGSLYRFYFHRVLPWIGGRISKDSRAYSYLPGSVDEFPAPERFVRMMEDAGFADCRAERFTGGVAYIYSGTTS